MMQAFRNAAKPVVYLITLTFLSWMVLDLSGLTGRGGGMFTRTSVGSINGDRVELRAYRAAVDAATQQAQQSGGALTLEQQQQLRDQVWDNFIETEVINDQIKANHISTSPAEIADWIKNVPPAEFQAAPDFQTNGKFDLAKYQRFLSSPVGQSVVPTLEAQSRDQILREKLFSAITADVYLSDAALWQRYRDQNEQVTISLSPIIGRNIVSDSAVPVTEAEIAEYYKAHTKELARPRTAYMSFIAVSRKLEASDSAAALERAKALHDEIAGGTSFEEVAKRELTDTALARKGGELGEFTKGQAGLDTALARVAFALPVNTVSEPVRTGTGYHLLQVTAKSSDKKAGDKITLRDIPVPIELAGKHRSMIDAELDSLQSLGAARLVPEALDTAARALKLTIGHTGAVPEKSRVQLGTYVIPDAGVWAFQAKVGETSPVIDGEVASYVFRLDSVQPAGTPSLVQVHDAVLAKVRDAKKDDRAKQIAQQFVDRVRKGTSMADAAKALGVPNREFGPFNRTSPPLAEPKIVGAAFGLPVGSVSNVLDTPGGFYVIKVLSRTKADSAEFEKDKNNLRATMIRALRNERVRDYVANLRETAKVTDRRADVFKTSAQTDAALAGQAGAGTSTRR